MKIMNDNRQEWIDGLKALTEFLDSHPAAPLPYLGTMNAFVETKEEMAEAARGIGGKIAKDSLDNFYYLRKEFGPIGYHVNIEREKICKKVVIGTRTIPATPERTIPASPEIVEEITEWQCGEILS